ncbi:unnamed protein product [Adineta steineri]|uniref:Uncharacterized protein n=2 Tax=Adineta steineri TaxID=433720 RepID=A0A819CPZ8_9BILA|nr:unnamed protein product [Adineta steineri]CAF3811464.1 unnamed protein product [Adineta steineri]
MRFSSILNEDYNQRLRFKRRIWILLIFIIVLIYLFYVIIIENDTSLKKRTIQFSDVSSKNFLDGCRYIYIDMGTNIGIQIRKLYEPQLYPNASVVPLFKRIFGKHTKEVCSVGFEANPIHSNYLKEFEKYCLKRNYRVKIYTSTAVSISNGIQDFYIQSDNKFYNYWDSSLLPNSNKTKISVTTIDIASWFKNIVLNRNISSTIMMKTDIEQHDSIVLTSLIFSGVYCSIDLIYGEHFNEDFRNAISILKQYTNSCKTELVYMDDETYHTRRVPFFITN